MYISAPTLDDLLRRVFTKLLNAGDRIRPSRGEAAESIAVLLQLKNPRARLSLTETKGRLASCLGELFWYLAGSNGLKFIAYYLSRYKTESVDHRTIWGAYGPRLFAMRGRYDQVKNVLALLKKNRVSRRAVIQLFDASDLAKRRKEIPCTCTLQFMLRQGRLHMFTYMRSNDAFLGLPHDVFAFTMIQEIFARTLGVEVGVYSHAVGSLHLYERHRKNARVYLKEGWQATTRMPSMPKADPWSSIARVLEAERKLRTARKLVVSDLNLDPYWADLVRLLQIYALSKTKDCAQIERLKSEMSSRVYDSYISNVINRLDTNRYRS